MTKRSLKERIAKLEQSLKVSEQDADDLRKQLAEYSKLAERADRLEHHNRKFKETFEKVKRRSKRIKARNEQLNAQNEMIAESCVLLRSELYSYIHATQNRSAKYAHQSSLIEQEMPGGGKPVLVDEEPVRGRERKRFGLKAQ